MKLFKSVFFYGLAGYAGWHGIQYATTTKIKFPSQPYVMIASLEPSSGEEELVCHMDDIQMHEGEAGDLSQTQSDESIN